MRGATRGQLLILALCRGLQLIICRGFPTWPDGISIEKQSKYYQQAPPLCAHFVRGGAFILITHDRASSSTPTMLPFQGDPQGHTYPRPGRAPHRLVMGTGKCHGSANCRAALHFSALDLEHHFARSVPHLASSPMSRLHESHPSTCSTDGM
jgi:hypothetical protein